MLSYTTPATIDANNREADRIMKAKGFDGVPHMSDAGKRSEALAKVHAEALARRRAG